MKSITKEVMKKYTTIAMYLLAFFHLTFQCVSQDVVPYPVPNEYISTQYIVSVNGKPVPVFHAGLNVYFASFDFTGEAQVKIIAGKQNRRYYTLAADKENLQDDPKGFWKGNARVRPLSRNIRPETQDSLVTFLLTDAGQYSIEQPGTSTFKDQVLFLFANRPGKDRPKNDDSRVIYLKPGIHQQHIDLKSGQTLYLEAGAVLFGSINVWDARDVRILGKGTVVYYGPQSEDHDDGWIHQKNWHPLTTHNVQGLTVSGITFIGRSRTWSLQMHTTFDAVFDNIKIIALNPQNINGDGFDWYGGGRTKIRNCMVRSMDDLFAFFTPNSSLDMWAVNKDTEGEVKDIEIENCVLWSTVANVYRVGFSGQNLKTENIVMRNCDVIHIKKGIWHSAPYAAICAISPNKKGKAIHSGYRFENVRFEESTAFLGLQNEEAQFTNIVFKDITMSGEPVPSYVKSTVTGLVFDNVRINGKLISLKDDVPFTVTTKNIDNLKFVPD